jgi:hypothetical protein
MLSPSARAVDVREGAATRYWSRSRNHSTGHDSRAIQINSKHIACASPWEDVDPYSDDPYQVRERPDPIRKIRPWVKRLNYSYDACRKPIKGQSIDESGQIKKAAQC